MAKEIPKLPLDVTPYFRYENESDPTTQDKFQAYLKNEHNVISCLVDGMWQATTNYQLGQIITSPNIPAGYQAVCTMAGTSSASEPSWIKGTSIFDGTCQWVLSKITITVNNISPDENGNIKLTTIDHADKATNADNATTANNCTGNSATATQATKDEKGQNIAGTYIKSVSGGYDAIKVTKGDGTEQNISIAQNSKPFTISGSTLVQRNLVGVNANGYDATSGSGNISNYTFNTVRALSSGTYTLASLLSALAANCHYHSVTKNMWNCNCDCNCDCGDDNCGGW